MNLEGRSTFFLGMILALVGNLIFYILWQFVLSALALQEMSHLILNWIGYAAGTLLATYLSLLFIQSQKYPTEDTTKKSLEKTFGRSFSIKNPKYIARNTLILITLIYIPLDLISYLLPNVLEFEAQALSAESTYFLWELPLMIITTLIIHFCVAFREEVFFRAYQITLGRKTLKKGAVFIYSTALFSLAHFSYIFSPIAREWSPLFPFWWALNAGIIGLVSAYLYINKRNIWPLIIAHWMNNVISAFVLRNYLLGVSIQESFMQIYLPILIIGVIVIVFTQPNLRENLDKVMKLVKSYSAEIRRLEKLNLVQDDVINQSDKALSVENSSENVFLKYILVDMGLILLLWLLSTFFF